MSDLDTVAEIVDAWYRLVASESGDQALEDQGEAVDDVAYINLTRGCRRAQRWMIRNGYQGWRKRSAALSFTGTDAADGGRKITLPTDFLRAYGNERRSALTQANGDRWGVQIEAEMDHMKGDHYYMRGEELWVTRSAELPTTLYLDYHYRHPEWHDSVTIDFPLEARSLISAEAAYTAMHDNWIPGGRDLEQKIARAMLTAQEEARHIVRSTKQPRTFNKVRRFGNRW